MDSVVRGGIMLTGQAFASVRKYVGELLINVHWRMNS